MSSVSLVVKVDKATSEFLTSPDWTLNMEICDVINANHLLARDVIKGVKKKLQHKNPKVHFYALVLLETLIKNCGDYVHSQVAERDILTDMVKIVKKKTDMQVRDKILVLLDSWQEAFGGLQGRYPQYYEAYIELKRHGIQFPRRSSDAAPILTPPLTHPVVRPSAYDMPGNPPVRLDEAMASEMGKLSLSDLESIRGVMEVLGDMLQAINPDDREAAKDELVVDLLQQCRSNQKKVMQLVTSTGDEELLAQGLALNDDLQYLIAKHDAIASGSPLPTNPSEYNQKASIPFETVAAGTAPHSPEGEEEEDADEFSQLARRKSKGKTVFSQNSTDTGDQGETVATSVQEVSSSGEATSSHFESHAPKTDPKEQDIVDLLSIVLSTNPSTDPTSLPETTTSVVPTSFETGPQVSVTPLAENPYYPHPYPVNPGYTPYSSYVAPWAQQTWPQTVPQSQYPQNLYPSSYPPPPWVTQLSSATSSFPTPANQYPVSHNHPSDSYAPVNAETQLQQHTISEVGGNSSLASGVQQQQQNSFGSRGGNPEPRPATPIPGSTPANKPFIPSYRLFEDLIDLRTSDGRTKTSSGSSVSGSPGQSMISSRK